MVLFTSDNSFWGGQENECLLLKIILLFPEYNKIIRRQQDPIDISNGLEFELKMYFDDQK